MITCGIATLPDRELSFKQTIESIYPQVDKIICVLNLYDTVPVWLQRMKRVEAIIGDNSLGDAGKFLEVVDCKGYYFSCDDDLYYPVGYVNYMIAGMNKHGCIVTLHGKCFTNRPIKSYHRGWTTSIHCLHTCVQDTLVDVGGTGVMAFNTSKFKLSIGDFPYPNMADIWVAKRAKEQGVNIMALAHRGGYLRYMPPKGKTIWENSKNDPYPTEVLNSFLR